MYRNGNGKKLSLAPSQPDDERTTIGTWKTVEGLHNKFDLVLVTVTELSHECNVNVRQYIYS